MIKIKSVLIAASLIMGLALPATAQIGEPRQNFSVGFNGGVNLNSASFTPKIKQNSLMGITGGLTARYISEKYFAMICGAQVELNISQRGWDELFEIMDANGQTVEDPTRSYTRKMTYIDIPFLAHLAFGKERGLQFFVNAGPQIGLLISESESMENIDMNKLTDTQKAAEYREVSRLTARLSLRLRDLLPDDDWNTVEKYEDAAAQLHSMELEAAFQAAFSLARELP